jgi:hypothetical protein
MNSLSVLLLACLAVYSAAFTLNRAGVKRASNSRVMMSETLGRHTGLSSMDTAVLNRYMSLDQKGKIQAEYIW